MLSFSKKYASNCPLAIFVLFRVKKINKLNSSDKSNYNNSNNNNNNNSSSRLTAVSKGRRRTIATVSRFPMRFGPMSYFDFDAVSRRLFKRTATKKSPRNSARTSDVAALPESVDGQAFSENKKFDGITISKLLKDSFAPYIHFLHFSLSFFFCFWKECRFARTRIDRILADV